MKGEDRRQLVHFAMTGFAATLAGLPPWAYWSLAFVALALNWIVFPLTGWDRGMRRPDSPWIDGAKLYPVAVILLLALFPPEVAAGAWGVMGVGDAASNVIGRRWGRPPFLGRSDRSLVGTVAFLACAWPAAWGLHALVGHESRPWAALAATVAGAAMEYLPLPKWLDDNIPIALAAGVVFHLTTR